MELRRGAEKNDGAKIYPIVKERTKSDMQFLLVQGVRWRNTGYKLIQLYTGKKYKFQWCGCKEKM